MDNCHSTCIKQYQYEDDDEIAIDGANVCLVISGSHTFCHSYSFNSNNKFHIDFDLKSIDPLLRVYAPKRPGIGVYKLFTDSDELKKNLGIISTSVGKIAFIYKTNDEYPLEHGYRDITAVRLTPLLKERSTDKTFFIVITCAHLFSKLDIRHKIQLYRYSNDVYAKSINILMNPSSNMAQRLSIESFLLAKYFDELDKTPVNVNINPQLKVWSTINDFCFF
ncbi:unnamed protein product, partial [Didymodactylos carnosus]